MKMGENDSGLEVFGLELTLTREVNPKEGPDVGVTKDLLALGHTPTTP